ncbi:hypothetical protein C8R48DRAFT_456435 [Suillus tomentosus]|nr:hypothetical protein C8R48DRAFT_456435 [Suillus tomentosus]
MICIVQTDESDRTSRCATPPTSPSSHSCKTTASTFRINAPTKTKATRISPANVMKQVFDILQDSTIVSKIGKDKRSSFWGVYKRVAEEHDGEFLE